MNEMSAEEFAESLTGFDEIAIQKTFGSKPVEMADVDKMGFLRSLYFIAQRRAGLTDSDAKKAALEATIGEVNDYFPDDDEPMPDDPATESGKGESEPGSTPTGSPSSASGPESSPASTQP